jgi:hypothetical protein
MRLVKGYNFRARKCEDFYKEAPRSLLSMKFFESEHENPEMQHYNAFSSTDAVSCDFSF